MATTTNIHVTAADNELYILACATSGSYEVCHIKSGRFDPVDQAVVPQSVLRAGDYTLIMVGINWGGPQAFKVTLTTDGADKTYEYTGSDTAVGANWTVAVPITV